MTEGLKTYFSIPKGKYRNNHSKDICNSKISETTLPAAQWTTK